MTPENLTLKQVSELFRAKELSPVEYTRHVLRRVQDTHSLNAIVTVDESLALRAAAASEKRYIDGRVLSPLDGIPIAIKDIIDTKELRTTYGCNAYRSHRPAEDAFAVTLLKKAGATICMKSNTSQFAIGATGDVCLGGPVKNPRNSLYTTGGSSSGSAAAVAGSIVPGALGTDSGGSIRLPSAICGIVGIKPTFSLVSNMGVLPVSESVDCVGPMAGTVTDAAMLLEAIAGFNPMDWRSAPLGTQCYTAGLQEPVAGTTAVILTNFFEGAILPEVSHSCNRAVQVLAQLGVTLQAKELPAVADFRQAHQRSMMAAAYTVHLDDIAAHRADIYDEVYTRLIAGAMSAQESWALEMQKNSFRQLLINLQGTADCVIYPTTPLIACKTGEGAKEFNVNGHTMSAYSSNGAFTWMASFSGLPCITIPVGATADNLPIGVSLMGKPFEEAKLIKIAHKLFDALH